MKNLYLWVKQYTKWEKFKRKISDRLLSGLGCIGASKVKHCYPFYVALDDLEQLFVDPFFFQGTRHQTNFTVQATINTIFKQTLHSGECSHAKTHI